MLIDTAFKSPRTLMTALMMTWACAAGLSTAAHAQDSAQDKSQDPAPRHAIAMHGASKYGPDFAHFDYVNPDAPKGGSMRLGAIGGFDTFNDNIPKGEPAEGIALLYDTLLTASADEPFSEYGLLAETVVMPEDRSWIVFNMRQQARWHDGRPVTAEDVKWTFETLMEKGHPLYQLYYAGVDKVEALDRRTVKFTFKPGENRELPMIVGQMVVLPKHYWQDRDFGQTTLEPPLGSGPYKVKSFEAGRYVEYERVADYWGKDLPVNVGKHNIATLRYEYFRDANVAVEAFKGGAFDFRAENNSKIWATAYDIAEVENGQLIKAESPHQRPQGMQGYAFNIRRDIFKDRRVRHALTLAFDFEWSNKNLFYGQYTRTRSYFDNSELAATGVPAGRELEILEPYRDQLPGEVFTQEYVPPTTDQQGGIRANFRLADQLLKDAGWVIRDKVRVHKDTGRKLSFEIMLVQPAFERITNPYIKNLERLGIPVTVRTVDSSQYIERYRSFDYDMIVMSWGQSMSPGNEQRDKWGSAAADLTGSGNKIGIKSPVVDDLIELLIAAPDRDELVQRVHALDRVLQWGHYVVPHWHIPYDRLLYWNKYAKPAVTPMMGTSTSYWWYDADKAAKLEAARGGGS